MGAWSRVEGYPSDPNPNDPLAQVTAESLFNSEGRLTPSITILGEEGVACCYDMESHRVRMSFPTGQGVNLHSERMVLNSIVLPHKELANCIKHRIIL